MIKGTIALYERATEWHPTNTGFSMTSLVTIGGKETYRLLYTPQWRTKSVKYQLNDMSGKLVNEWSQKQRWLGARMDLSINPDYPLEYIIGWTGGCSFVTPTKKFRPYFTILDRSKTAEIDGISFEHHDFESEMNFECAPDSIPQAIMIANLLFNIPVKNNDDSLKIDLDISSDD